MKLGAMCGVLGVAVLWPAAVSGQPAVARVPGVASPDYFIQSQRREAIRLDTSRIALDRAVADRVGGHHPLLAPSLTMEVFEHQAIALVPLTPAARSIGIDSTFTRLVDEGISFVGMVIALPRTRETRILTNTLIVNFREHVRQSTQDSLYNRYGLVVASTTPRRPRRVLLRPQSGNPLDALRAANSLAEQESLLVSYAHPNFYIEKVPHDGPPGPHPPVGRAIPVDACRSGGKECLLNDTRLAEQWNLADIDAPEAWCTSLGFTEAPIIAIIDGSIMDTHLDLNVVPNPDQNPRQFVGRDLLWDPYSGDPTQYHGTAVAGTALAVGGNHRDIAGVCPTCSLLPLWAQDLVSPASELGEFAQQNAVFQAMDDGAWVINISFSSNAQVTDDESTTLHLAATEGRDTKGVVVVVATPDNNANSPVNIDTLPHVSSLPWVIGVTQTNLNGRRFPGAPRGNEMDIAAPGENILVITPDGTRTVRGSSFSAAMVSGVAALVLAANPNLTAAEVRQVLIDTADKVDGLSTSRPFDPVLGFGRVNANCAVERALALAAP